LRFATVLYAGTNLHDNDSPPTEGELILIEERITEKTDAQGNVIETTIERDHGVAPVTVNAAPASSGGGFGGIIAIILLAVLAVGGYFLFTKETENRKDEAIAEAADNVGAAAEKAGNAIEKAVDKIDGK
jgi:hypothetical protein